MALLRDGDGVIDVMKFIVGMFWGIWIGVSVHFNPMSRKRIFYEWQCPEWWGAVRVRLKCF